jgi:hypothetical protein
MAFRCVGCGQDFVFEATLAPESTLRCSSYEKLFGRTDAVVTQMVRLSSNISTDMLKLALQKLRAVGGQRALKTAAAIAA